MEATFEQWRRGPTGTPAIGPLRIRLSESRDVAKAITKVPATMHGTPVFRGTGVPVKTLFDYLEAANPLEDFLKRVPTVTRALVLEALDEAKHLLLTRD